MKISFLFTLLFSFFAVSVEALELGAVAPSVLVEEYVEAAPVEKFDITQVEEGQKYKLVEFFSITCGACMQNMPIVSKLASEIATTTNTVLVSIDRRLNEFVKFLKNFEQGLDMELSEDVVMSHNTKRDSVVKYNIKSIPTTFILNENNEIVYKHVGVMFPKDIAKIKDIVND